MILHQDRARFEEAIRATAIHFNISGLYVEKDYWVTYVLKRLSVSRFKNHAIFKGGTSLSKALRVIERFSEDIDLAVSTKGMSGNQIKNLIRDIEQDITQGLKEENLPNITSKGTKFRKTAFLYEKIFTDTDFGQVRDLLLVEVNAFANPHPFRMVKIQSLIADYLMPVNKILISRFELEPFEVNVLGLERTLAEKLLALVRASYRINPIKDLEIKIRHIYDLHMIIQSKKNKDYVITTNFFNLIKEVQQDDARNKEFQGEWNSQPLSNALLFSELTATWDKLKNVYNNNFSVLVYGKLPSDNEIVKTLQYFRKVIKKYDEWSSKNQ